YPLSTLFPYTTLFASAPVRVGVVGAGSLGYHHVRILRDVEGAQLSGFFEERSERASEVETELGVKAYSDLALLLEYVDAVTTVRSEEHTSELQSLAYL